MRDASRFGNEIAGLPELGTTGRGNDMQIGTYVQSMLGWNYPQILSIYAQSGRLHLNRTHLLLDPGNCTKTESIDVMDAVGSAIRIDTRDVEVMRIQPGPMTKSTKNG